jgi:hypothetical protein
LNCVEIDRAYSSQFSEEGEEMSVYPRKYRDLIGELSYASSFYYIIGDN